MSIETITQPLPQTEAAQEWEPPMPPTDLIFDDGEPLETYRHRKAMNVLIDSVEQAYADRNDFFVGGNMFVYYSRTQVKNRDFRGPDFFAVLNVDRTVERQGWVVWDEQGRYPDVIIELLSSSTAEIDTGIKKDLYENTFRTPDYFVFNPYDPNSLQGWHLDNSQQYQPLLPNEQGWLWCQTLGFWVGTWFGSIQREATFWLRFYDEGGNLVLLADEAAQQELEAAQQELEAAQQELEAAQQQAETAQQQAETAQQQAETAQQQAETAQQQAETAQQQAEAAQQQAEAAQQQTEAAQQQAVLERDRAERLAARLRELGEDPNDL